MRKPLNTEADAQENPLGVLATAAVMGIGRSIEAQEADGQQELVKSDVLPAEIQGDGRAALEKAGVKFMGPVDGDSFFVYAELPAGWRKQGTDHSMWSKLFDAKGRERAAIFYKAAFYDRKAHMSVLQRYSVGQDYAREESYNYFIRDNATGETIHIMEPVVAEVAGQSRWERGDMARTRAKAWLQEHLPEFEDAAAYWD